MENLPKLVKEVNNDLNNIKQIEFEVNFLNFNKSFFINLNIH